MARDEKIGTTSGGMTLLTTLGFRAFPHPSYRPFAEVRELDDGTTRGQGFPVASWHWDVVSVAERALIYAFLSGDLSASVYIRTRLPDNTYASFSCVMHWPTGDENLQAGQILDFTVEFTLLEAV